MNADERRLKMLLGVILSEAKDLAGPTALIGLARCFGLPQHDICAICDYLRASAVQSISEKQ
jgi:hypothetical protein